MTDHHYILIKGSRMTTYIFKVVVEPDEDKWSAYCPALLKQGAATWGDTEEEALRHIHEVVQMVVQTLLEDGEPIPEDVLVSPEPLVSITIRVLTGQLFDHSRHGRSSAPLSVTDFSCVPRAGATNNTATLTDVE